MTIIKLFAEAARLDTIVAEHYAKRGISGVRVLCRGGKLELHLSADVPPIIFDDGAELEMLALRFGGPVIIAPAEA